MLGNISKRVAAITGALVWLIAPVVAVLYLGDRGDDQSLAAEGTVWVPVREASETTTTAVNLSLEYTEAPTVLAPMWDGLVERVLLEEGDTLANGTPIVVIGGATRIGFATEWPLSRVLAEGDAGGDVGELNRMLEVLGHRHGTGNTFTASTTAGVGELATSLGIGHEVQVFDPAWVVFLPVDELTVSEVDLTVGTLAPGQGQAILTGTGDLTGARLIEEDAADDARPDEDVGGDGSEPDGDSAEADGDDGVGSSRVVAPDDATLLVGQTEIGLNDARDGVSGEGLEVLRERVRGSPAAMRGRLERPSQPEELVVPAGAVYAMADGKMCVLRREGGQNHGVEVQVGGGDVGQSVVSGPLEVGDEVAVSPPARDRVCT